MDKQPDLLESERSIGKFTGFRDLVWLNPDDPKFKEFNLDRLWANVRTQDYAFDDFSRDKPEWFLWQLANSNENVRYFLIGDYGLFLVNGNLQVGGDATVHFIVWDRNISLHINKAPVYELFDWLFYEVKVHRISGPIPSYNKLASRFAMVFGMKFEGELQEAVLWKGKYYNVSMFGLLEKWYRTRRENIII
jgi:RimJ/RimL family protein N-acetyltransferase